MGQQNGVDIMQFNNGRLVTSLLATLIASGAMAQDGPSWRTERPERPEALPEVERPEFEFSIDRDELMGGTGLAPANEDAADAPADPAPLAEAAPEPEPAVAEPEPVVAEPQPAMAEPEPERFAAVNTPAASAPQPEPVETRVPAPRPRQEPARRAEPEAAPAFRLVRINDVAPEYPRHAWMSGQEGWVDLELTVGPDGKVDDVHVVNAEPRRVFEKAALRAAMRWRFEAPEDHGIHEPQQGTFRVSFRMDG